MSKVEYHINDRLSFQNFLGLASGDKIPDAKTIWKFSEELAQKELTKKMFDKFTKLLIDNNLIMNEGKMIDGSFVEVLRQRNTPKENKKKQLSDAALNMYLAFANRVCTECLFV